MKTIFDNLTEEAIKDPYLLSLICRLEEINGYLFFNLSRSLLYPLNEKEFFDILRFADIMSKSNISKGKEIAYKIISLLYETYYNNELFNLYAESVLTKIGLFPSLELLTKSENNLNNIEITFEKILKSIFQFSPIEEKYFTDSQFKVYSELIKSDNFSFSGPTSFGKSFIIDSFIKNCINNKKSENVIVLVPTKALISQFSKRIRNYLTDNSYKIVNYANIPEIFLNQGKGIICILTPERWIHLCSKSSNIKFHYMLVDEAHKILSKEDDRAPLFYHAVQLAKRKDIKLYFSCPNILNTEIFLNMFYLDKENHLSIHESPVSQNKFFVDLIDNKAMIFLEDKSVKEIPYSLVYEKLEDKLNTLFKTLGRDSSNLVYCNSIDVTIKFANSFSNSRDLKSNPKLEEYISVIASFIHNDYFLIECLKHGVGYHFGSLPQKIREIVEHLFEEKLIDFVFCTSTLLEGVNLPAKNIFIISNANGNKSFTELDFGNLAGRAGRLTKELSGNVICVRCINKRNYWKNENSKDIINSNKLTKLHSVILDNTDNFYNKLKSNLTSSDDFSLNNNKNDFLSNYSTILYLNIINNSNTVLHNKFKDSVEDYGLISNQIIYSNAIPSFILEQSTNINPYYQNQLWNNVNQIEFSSDTSYSNCLLILETLYDSYNWIIEENKSYKSFIKSKLQLKYYAHLLSFWISDYPISRIIKEELDHTIKSKKVWLNNKLVDYDGSKNQINSIINSLMNNIEVNIKFKIKLYLNNYINIFNEKNKSSKMIDWLEYIEFGTKDPIIIELQTLGLERQTSKLLKDKCIDLIDFDEYGKISNYNKEQILIRVSDSVQESLEIQSIL